MCIPSEIVTNTTVLCQKDLSDVSAFSQERQKVILSNCPFHYFSALFIIMLITAKLTTLSCFVNTILQPCLISGKLFISVAYDFSALSRFNAII